MTDITITNNSKTNIALFMRVKVTKGQSGEEVLPALFSDNYISLWPGESNVITAQYAESDMGTEGGAVEIRR